jgi:hypothetical protein
MPFSGTPWSARFVKTVQAQPLANLSYQPTELINIVRHLPTEQTLTDSKDFREGHLLRTRGELHLPGAIHGPIRRLTSVACPTVFL